MSSAELLATENVRVDFFSPPKLRAITWHKRRTAQIAAAFRPVQRTVRAEYIPPMSLDRFCEITGLSRVLAWRYEKRGWLRTHLIANRRYILAADVAQFNKRLASDEFVADSARAFLHGGGVRRLHPECRSVRDEIHQTEDSPTISLVQIRWPGYNPKIRSFTLYLGG